LSRLVALLTFLVELIPIVDEHVDVPGHATLTRFGIKLQAVPGKLEVAAGYHNRLIAPDEVIV
jgi:hypothetical protein